ncbi:MAG TPA: restriction endonuclease [Candidatus Kapabacteria bacterium]|nr:restriction endonuclease [Candidatus Kapabacteria bacterium]
MNLYDAIATVLADAGAPLHYEDISDAVAQRGLWVSEGKTPQATVVAYLSADIKRKGVESRFQRTASGVYGLRSWGLPEFAGAAGNGRDLDENGAVAGVHRVRTPLFPRYATVRHLLTLLDGVPKAALTNLIGAIADRTGTPQNPVDWSDPDSWIGERLSGADAELARTIWNRTNRTVNPRHLYGSYLFISNFDLLSVDADGVYRMNERSRAFLANDPALMRELDDLEGMTKLLGILATKTRARSSDLMPEWKEFLLEYSRFRTDSTLKDTLRRRVRNLVERGLAERDGMYYSITNAGLEYLKELPRSDGDDRRDVGVAIGNYNAKQREMLRARLSSMSPYRFEELVGDLLEAMGYQDVTVTKESGDKGVDVVATVQFGITTITEVVQVKRHQGNIGRPVLDQLRGSLPYHKALRGTIITTGGFSSGCMDAALFPGAAPIGLIDGNRLLDLLIEHEIGIHKRPALLYDIDEETFADSSDEAVATNDVVE